MIITCANATKLKQIQHNQTQARRIAPLTDQELIGKPVNQIVNIVGKYLYNTVDSAYKIKNTTNTCDVYMKVYYQIPQLSTRPGRTKTYSDIYEMGINISLTTYQNKLRMNLIVMDPEEETLNFTVWAPEKLINLEEAKKKILTKVEKTLTKYFAEYEFIF